MKPYSLFPFALSIVALLGGGCASLDVESSGDPDRVLKGAVNAGAPLPAGAEIVVRLLVVDSAVARSPAIDTGLATRSAPPGNRERLLGEHRQVLAAGTTEPVPFQIEYRADDALLRRGVNVEARVSVAGRLRYRTINAHVVTLTSAAFRQEIAVQAVQ